MSCGVCSHSYSHNRWICNACYDGVKDIMLFLNNQEKDSKGGGGVIAEPNKSPVSGLSLSQGTAGALKWIKEIKKREEGLNYKLDFLGGLVVAFRDGIHSDIQVKPANGLPIPAHRAVLSTRSAIFKNMLESDECKTAPSDTISLLELDHDELESLLEFLYAGDLDTKKIEKHVYPLFIAAQKYDIPYLQKFCEHRMLESLASSNALEVLEITDVCANKIFKEAVMNFVVKNMNDIVFSTRFEEFARKNPLLSVEITRASFKENSGKKEAVFNYDIPTL